MRYFNGVLTLLLPLVFSACQHSEYDTSRGVDPEMTLFTDKVSIPIADIGPISPKQLLGDFDLESILGDLFKEDAEGYLVTEEDEILYSDIVYYLNACSPDPTKPQDVKLDDITGYPGISTELSASLGLMPAMQEFSLYALNPLTEEIAISGQLTMPAQEKEVFDTVPVAASSQMFEWFHKTLGTQRIQDGCSLENMILHLPASIMEKDPLGGWSPIGLGYHYKAYLSFGTDFPMPIPIPVDDLNLPLAKYKVKDVLISMEVVNEIPVTLVLDNVEVFVDETDAEGNVQPVICEDVSITPGLTIASGCSGAPVVSPLAINIKAQRGTIPDIASLNLYLSVKVPTGEGDKRLNLNQSVSFNKLRATVSGGITIQ